MNNKPQTEPAAGKLGPIREYALRTAKSHYVTEAPERDRRGTERRIKEILLNELGGILDRSDEMPSDRATDNLLDMVAKRIATEVS